MPISQMTRFAAQIGLKLSRAVALGLPLAGLAMIATGSPAIADATSPFDRAFNGMAAPIRATPKPAEYLETARQRPIAGISAMPAEALPAAAPEAEAQHLGTGVASYYGRHFSGKRTANGDKFDPDGYTAAHRTLPFGSKVRVTNSKTGASVIVRINDRGPWHGNRLIDLSDAAARDIGLIGPGSGRVELALVSD